MHRHTAGDSIATQASMFDRLRGPDPTARETAWNDFRARYAPIITRFAKRFGASIDRCEDVVQDVMLGFFSVSSTFKYDPTKGRFRGYLKACVRSALIKRMGQDLRFEGVQLEKLNPADERVDQAWTDVWETEHLRLAIAQLRQEFKGDPKTIRAFEEYVLKDRDAAEVAAELGVKVNSVHQAKRRISDALRVRLVELEEGLR